MIRQQIEIDGITIEIHRKAIKNMHLRIYPPDGRVQVSAPLRLSLKHIRNLLIEKRDWLHAQRTRLQSLPVVAAPTLSTGEQHYFLGQTYPLTLINNQGPPSVTFINNVLILNSKKDATPIEKMALLKRWYQLQMYSLIPDLIKKWQPIMGVSVADWGVKSMKTRWGSCNTRARRIWLNLVLIEKPILCLEYVLVHEMVHLLEASHNARFYQLMDRFMPEWRIHQKVLYAYPKSHC